MTPIRIAIVGLGKIARDQHLPAIAGNEAFELAATISPRQAGLDGVPNFRTLGDLLAADTAIDAIALCTPPQVRYALVSQALAPVCTFFLRSRPARRCPRSLRSKLKR